MGWKDGLAVLRFLARLHQKKGNARARAPPYSVVRCWGTPPWRRHREVRWKLQVATSRSHRECVAIIDLHDAQI